MAEYPPNCMQVAAETELGRLLKEQRAHYESMILQLKHEYDF